MQAPLWKRPVPVVLGVVLVGVNLLRQMVLLLIQRGAVGRGEMSIVELAHVMLFVIYSGFLLFKIVSLAGGELAAFYAIANAVLLVFLALIDGGRRIGRGWGGRGLGSRG